MAAAPPSGGILRRPRYSSSSLSSAASATANDNDGASSDTNNDNYLPPPSVPHRRFPPTTTPTKMSGNNNYSLAGMMMMVKSVTDLNKETSLLGFSSVVNDTAITANCDCTTTSASLSSGMRLHHQEATTDDDRCDGDEDHDPLLLISNNSIITPPIMYSISNTSSSITTSSSPNVDAVVSDASKNPVIANNAVGTVGVIGDNGQGVHFCQDQDYGDEGKNMTTTIRDRLGGGGGDQNTIIDIDNTNVDTIDIDKDDETAADSSDSESYDSGSANGDEDVLQKLGISNFFNQDNNNDQDEDEEEDEEDEEEEYDNNVIHDQHHVVRPFRVLWEILTRWATPSTVELVLTYQSIQQYEQHQTLQQQNDLIHHHLVGGGSVSSSSSSSNENNMATVPRNDVDIGASRQAGIMSMVKMHVPRAFAELQRIQQERGVVNQKLVEQRLANLVRTFDPSVPAINLNTKLWKGLTTILIAIAFPRSEVVDLSTADDDNKVVLPPSILVLDMTAAEYRYLTCSVYTSLCSVD